MVETAESSEASFHRVLSQVADEMHVDTEEVALAESVPLPPGANERRKLIGLFGQLSVYVFDPYSIALSKIARGFEADLEDVLFMLQARLIDFAELERLFALVVPRARETDIIPDEFTGYFRELRRRAVGE